VYRPGATTTPAPYARPARPNGAAQFWQGYGLGLAGGSLLALLALAAALVFFAPGRTNILILGLDRRPDETTYVTRTDTMMLATVYPRAAYAGLLSIPRDLYVTLPAGTQGRINTAHFFAEADTAGSGPEAAMATVRSNFGVDVHHYVRIDLMGFVRIVDALGGIAIDVPGPLIDYEYPTYDYGTTVVEFEAGPQHMDGERALAYARIRHGSSDFQRAERQQLVIEAIFRRLLSPAAWVRLPLVMAAVGQSVDTDMNALQVLLLAPTLLRVGPSDLDRRVIQGEMVQPYTTDGGGSVQLPVWEEINPVLLEMFGQ
jgi:LCP family protein required for cell wall assembly